MRRSLVAWVLVLAFVGSAVAEEASGLATKVFEIRHKEMDEVVSLIEGALSDESSVLMRRSIRTIFPG